jgi:hypothetical protein
VNSAKIMTVTLSAAKTSLSLSPSIKQHYYEIFIKVFLFFFFTQVDIKEEANESL